MRRRRTRPARSSCPSSPTSVSTAPAEESTPPLGGAIADALEAGEISGQADELASAREGRSRSGASRCRPRRAREFDAQTLLARYAGTAVRYLGQAQRRELAIALPDEAQGTTAAARRSSRKARSRRRSTTTIYRRSPTSRIVTDRVAIFAGGFDAHGVEAGVERGTVLGEAVNFARMHGAHARQRHDADASRRRARKSSPQRPGSTSTCSTKSGRASKGMGSFLGVSRGSATQPAEVHRDDATTAIRRAKSCSRSSAKGITFDYRRHLDQTGRAHGRNEVRHVAAAPA